MANEPVKMKEEKKPDINVFANPYELSKHVDFMVIALGKLKDALSFNSVQALRLENRVASHKTQLSKLAEEKAKMTADIKNRVGDTEAELQRMKMQVAQQQSELNALKTRAKNDAAAALRDREMARKILEDAESQRRQAMSVAEAQTGRG